MIPPLTRRRFLSSLAAATGATALAPVLPDLARGADPIRLAADRRTIEVNGKAASVFGLRQPDGTPGVTLDPGQRFAVELANRCGEPTIVHWHGQTPPVRQDGVEDTRLVPLIPNGKSQRYDYAPRPGTHWMHSHQGLQEQLLMAAPLVVRSNADATADVQEVVVLFHDFSFRDPARILAELAKGGGMAGMDMGADHSSMPGMKMNDTSDMSEKGHGSAETDYGDVDLNDIDFDAYLANDRTLADPMVVRTERGGRVRLRLINGASATAFWIELGGLSGTVIAVDGDPVKPVEVRRFPMAMAQRVDVMVAMPAGGGAFPILAQREGDRARTGIVLATPGAAIAKIAAAADAVVAPIDLSLERRLETVSPPTTVKPDVVHRVALTGQMMPYNWGINGKPWAKRAPLAVAKGQRVALDVVNRTHMAHPMHLHGHHFQVVAIDGNAISGAMRDTVLVPVAGSVRIAFDADNPGRWLFHCHNLYHMLTGMMTEIVYKDFA